MPHPPLNAWTWPEPVTAEPAEGGLINLTWWVTGASGRHAVVQELNTRIFRPEVHEDIEAVTSHLAARGLDTPRLLRTRAQTLWATEAGRVYRALTLVGDRTVHTVDDPALAFEAARLVGRVHAALADLRWDFRMVRPGAHDTDAHAAGLERAVAAHGAHRLADPVRDVAADLLARWRTWEGPRGLPERTIHGDLKISNVRFRGPHAAALIDLDTWQRGTLDVELGDAMRSWCNRSGEDATEARVDLEVFAAAMAGYAEGAPGFATETEWQGLAAGLERIALELAMRFARDALEESYFGFDAAIGRGEHNLLRARGQLALARAARLVRPELDSAVARARVGG